MPTPRTRPLPGMVLILIAVPTTVWVTLIVVVWVLAALDQRAPFGGFWSIGIALSVTTTLGAFGIWALGIVKAHISSELATYYGMFAAAEARVPQACSAQFLMIEEQLQHTVPIPPSRIYVSGNAAAGATQTEIATRPADIDGYLAETADIYDLGFQAGLAARDDDPDAGAPAS